MRVNWNYEKVKEFVKENSDCELLSKEYKNQNTLMIFQCQCGEYFEVNWKDFYSSKKKKRQCNSCGYARSNIGRKHTIEEINNILKPFGSKVYDEEYKDVKSLLKIECQCGTIFETLADYIFNATRRQCYNCQPLEGNRYKSGEEPTNRKTHSEFASQLKSLRSDEYEIIGEYKDAKSQVRLKHIPCGKFWDVMPDKLINAKQECPNCIDYNNSTLSKVVMEWLDNKGFEYKREFTFNDCVLERSLRFDFAIFINGKLHSLIEADGEQHYRPSNLFGGVLKFEQTKMRDEIKDEYCLTNNIKLIRIPYFKIKEVDTILEYTLQDNTEPSH